MLDVDTISVAAAYYASQGSEKATLMVLALVRESLLIRAKSALGEINDAGVDAVHQGTNEALEATIAELEQRNADLDQLASELYGQNLTLKATVNAVQDDRQSAQEEMNKALDRSSTKAQGNAILLRELEGWREAAIALARTSNKKADKEDRDTARSLVEDAKRTGSIT